MTERRAGPRRHRLPSGVMVDEGMLLELTRDEVYELAELCTMMTKLARSSNPGWLHLFVRDLSRVNRIIHGAVERSHAAPGQPRKYTGPGKRHHT